ncbi:MAG: hypothetical protein P1P74_11605 [Desulfuromonadales bacterium]|nr:hypothetical protein [Desulfuromonadales bacterium]
MKTKKSYLTKKIIFTSIFVLFFCGIAFGKAPLRPKIETMKPAGGTYTCDPVEKICTCNPGKGCEEMAKDGVCDGNTYCSPEGPCGCYTKIFDPVPLNRAPGKFPRSPYSGVAQ